MIQQQIVKNKKQIVYGKNKKNTEKLIKALKIELDELNDSNTKFIKYLKSKAEETDIDDLAPTFDEIADELQEKPIIPSVRPSESYTPNTPPVRPSESYTQYTPSYTPYTPSVRPSESYIPYTPLYTSSTLPYTPSTTFQQPWQEKIKKDQQPWQEKIKKDQQPRQEKIKKNNRKTSHRKTIISFDQEIEKQVKDKELERLKNKARERKKKAYKEYFGYGIIPPIYPTKMLINLIKLLARIYEGYASEQVVSETKRLLNTLYNNKIITQTVYNHLANI